MKLAAWILIGAQPRVNYPSNNSSIAVIWGINSVSETTMESSEDYGHGDCIRDFRESRILHHQYSDDLMTVEKCQDICTSGYYKYYGVENGSDCYCGYFVHPYEQLSESDCNKPCAGNASAYCGGASAMNIYKVETKCEKESRENPPIPGRYTPQCIETGVNVGAFEWEQVRGSTGYSWCVDTNGNRLTGTLTPPGPSDIDCKPYYTGQCLRDHVLSGEIFLKIFNGPEYKDDEMTIDLCFDSCQDAFFKFAGLKNGNECQCGNQIQVLPWYDSRLSNMAELESKIVPDIECGEVCPGDSSETCGGPNKMKIYNVRSKCEIQRDDALQWYIAGLQWYNPNGSFIPKCLATGEYAPEQCSVFGLCYCVDVNGNQLPLTTKSCSTFFTGQCIEDNSNTKILNFLISTEFMTPDFCEGECKTSDSENVYYGVEDSTDCYCGKNLNTPVNYLPARFCDSPCASDNTQICGGSSKMNLFSIEKTEN